MRRQDVLNLLNQHIDRLRRTFHVKSLALFGSVARDETRADSDVDILVEFDKIVGLRGFMDCRFELEEILGCHVDLVMASALRPSRRPYVESEAIPIA